MTLKVDGTNGVLQAYDYQVLTTGFSYTFAAGVQLLLAVPAGTLATGTVTMPASPVDGMNITITSTQQITALTINANTGQSIVGGGAILLPAGGTRVFVYRLANTTWYSQAVAQAVPPSDVQTFTSTGTWTKPAGGQTMALIQVWGGGGGGGRSSTANIAGGGGGGAYNEVTVPLSYLAATVTATVGSGGTAATTTAVGGDGGNSSFALATAVNGRSSVDAYGGAGGTNVNTSLFPQGGGTLAAGTRTNNFVVNGTSKYFDVGGGYDGASSYESTWGGGYGQNANLIGKGNYLGGSGFGGGGGGGGTSGAAIFGGRSLYGGAGGTGTISGTAGDGTQPGGGGGASYAANTNGGAGGAGKIVVTCW